MIRIYAIFFSVALLPVNIMAQEQMPLFQFEFRHQTNYNANHISSLFDTDIEHSANFDLSRQLMPVKFKQYDATWEYPWESKYYNIGVGVTLRYLTGIKNTTGSLDNRYFQETMPLLHASAIFNLPFKGLTAGFEGSHLKNEDNRILDYRAKVAYEWRQGFGLEGGWQHQQFNLNKSSETATDYKHNGVFLDFYLKF